MLSLTEKNTGFFMRNEQISLQKTKISGHRMVKIKVLGSLR